jgi:hypothetical protein
LFHNQLLVLDLDILPIVFGIEDGGWIIGQLLVIVDHPILVEMSSQRVIEHCIDIDGVVAKVLVQMMSVDSIMAVQKPATWTDGTESVMDKGTKC